MNPQKPVYSFVKTAEDADREKLHYLQVQVNELRKAIGNYKARNMELRDALEALEELVESEAELRDKNCYVMVQARKALDQSSGD